MLESREEKKVSKERGNRAKEGRKPRKEAMEGNQERKD